MKQLAIIGAALLAAPVFLAAPAKAEIRQSTGKVTFLRVHDVGTKYGPPADQLDVEVVIKLSTEPRSAFGFRLRNDANLAAHQGMLDLLRDAFGSGSTVTIDYDIPSGKKNGTIIRTWLTKP